jgi:hypothetical protein
LFSIHADKNPKHGRKHVYGFRPLGMEGSFAQIKPI